MYITLTAQYDNEIMHIMIIKKYTKRYIFILSCVETSTSGPDGKEYAYNDPNNVRYNIYPINL